jgi:hypothetical protein
MKFVPLLLVAVMAVAATPAFARQLTAQEDTRSAVSGARKQTLKGCVSSAKSVASSSATSTISEAVAEAFSTCNSCPCTSSASTAAEAISYAVARALASVSVSVQGDDGKTRALLCFSQVLKCKAS